MEFTLEWEVGIRSFRKGGSVAILNGVFRESLTEKVTLEQRLEPWDIWAKRILGRQRSLCKGPETEAFLMCTRNSKEDSVAAAQKAEHLDEQ